MFNFEYSLENGKSQLRNGFTWLTLTVAILVLWFIVWLACLGCGMNAKEPNNIAALVFVIFTGVFAICAIFSCLMTVIKVIFGAVVYHAERTASKKAEVVEVSNKVVNIEKAVKVEKPVNVEKAVKVEKPVNVEKAVKVEKPVKVAKNNKVKK